MSEACPPQAGLVPSSSRHVATLIAGLVRRGLNLLDMVEMRHDEPAEIQQLRQAAAQGDAQAQYRLGLLYADGKGMPQDYTAAMHWWRQAAEHGYPDAQYTVGLMYLEGDVVRSLRTMPSQPTGTARLLNRTRLTRNTASASCTLMAGG
jgi:uncharacterized protein